MPRRKPLAFMSYVRFDDEHDEGRLSEFCERLSGEVRVQTGEQFPIFHDRKDIQWGQNWEQRIDESLDEVTLLIPIITPNFFNSQKCRDELRHFLEREKKLKRNDLILPVYYVDWPLLNDPAKRATDELAQTIADRQYADWRDLRFEPFASPQVRRTLARLAVQIRDALERVQAARKPAVPEPEARPTAREPSVGISQDAQSVMEVAEAVRRPSAKTEPPTRVVDPMYRGDHATITEAIEAASPGDRILVSPGLYEGGLVIDKPLEVIGQGDPGEVVVQATGEHALLFKTTMGRVANLTLRQMGGGAWYSVNIAQGCLELEECDITSRGLACVAIHGGADPRVRRNRIHDSEVGGIFVYDKGQGTLEDNDIFGNAFSGVEIKEGGNPTVRGNRIHDGKQSGVYVHSDGQGKVEDNDIFGNALPGVAIKEGGNPTVRGNRIHDNKQAGILVYDNGQGTLEDNDIFGNAFSGVEIKEGSNPTVRGNRIHDNKQTGVYVHSDGQGTVEDNNISGNAFSGVEIREGGSPTVRGNRIHDGKQNGILIQKNGQGTLEDNDIFGNALSGVEIREGGNPMVRRNRINKNRYQAVWLHDGGAGTIEDNDFRDNTKGAWLISEDSEPNVKRARNLE